ncbi:hypothetical protein [Sphingomonas sp. NBWT7]|nr:hypothetical protein [Sphingomonas sp. NBWT7]
MIRADTIARVLAARAATLDLIAPLFGEGRGASARCPNGLLGAK